MLRLDRKVFRLGMKGSLLRVLMSSKNGSDDKKEKTGPQEENDKSVSVALIGCGITPAYTALLLKQERIIKFIYVADTDDKCAGLMLDANHVDTSTKIRYFKRKNITDALREVDIIALMDETDFTSGRCSSHGQFLASSGYVKTVAETMVKSCPNALVAVFANPVTANLPLVSEVYKRAGLWNPDRIVGSTAIHSMRMESIAANFLDLNPAFATVPIVGGADVCTVVPLLSRAKPINQFSTTQQESLIRSLRSSENELASIDKGGMTLSSAAAAAKFILTMASGCCGSRPVAGAYVRSNVMPLCQYFATEIEFGAGGVTKNFGLPKVSKTELDLIEQAIPIINANADLAEKFIAQCNE